MKSRLCAAVLVLLAAYVCFTGLDTCSFWDDEAHVSLFARQILKTGAPLVWDGRNLVPDHNSGGVDEKLRNILDQLDNYVTALSFYVFGESVWAARFPFACAGLLALCIFWFLLEAEFPDEPVLRMYAFAGMALSVNFLLYSRSCRYFAFSVLFTMMVFHGYRRFLDERGWRWVAWATVGASLLALNSILNCVVVMGSLVVRHILFHLRDFKGRDWLKIAVGAAVFCLVAYWYVQRCVVPLPKWKPSVGPPPVKAGPPPPSWAAARLTLLCWNIEGVNLINAFPWVVVLLLCGGLALGRRDERGTSVAHRMLEFLTTLVAYLLILPVVSPQPVHVAVIADVRYLTPFLFVMAILCAGAYWFLHRHWPLVAVLLFAIQLNTTLLSLTPKEAELRVLLPALVMEVHRPYPVAMDAVVKYVRTHARKDDTVWVSPAAMGKALVFFAGDWIKVRGVLDRYSRIPKSLGDSLDRRLYLDQVSPDWVILFGAQHTAPAQMRFFSREDRAASSSPTGSYRLVDVLDWYYEEKPQRPELPWHKFSPVREFNRTREAVYIFKNGQKK